MSLRFSDLRLSYGRRQVLCGLDLPDVPDGSRVALLGGNGAGKSSVLRALAGVHPARGRIELDGQALHGLSTAQRTRWLGYLPQQLAQGSRLLAWEALLSQQHSLPGRRLPAVEETRLLQVAEQLQIGELLLRPLRELSCGQRQVIGLAQVLLRQPRLLLLDEPTSALDLRWQWQVLQAVGQCCQAQGSLALIALHDINLAARFCDRLLLLGKGRCLAYGTAEQVLQPDILRALYGVTVRVERCSQGRPLVLADPEALS